MPMLDPNIPALWKRAHPISTAYITLSAKPIRERYEHLIRNESLHARIAKFGQYIAENSPEPLNESIASFRKDNPLDAQNELYELIQQRRKKLLEWINQGQLKAFGFATPRRHDDRLVEVPHDLWLGKISWDHSYIEANGLRIESVRVIPTQWLKEKPKPFGRPSRKAEIDFAYSDLKETNRIDFIASTLKAAAQQVIDHIKTLNPNHPDGDKGIQSTAVQRAIRDDFNREKAARSKV